MSDFNSPQPDPNANAQPNEKPTAYCQNCGKPLTPETVRAVGQSVFCEPCLDARVHNTPGSAPGYAPVNTGAAGGWANATSATSEPNPGLAFLLGLIPGVGAMYNEQYAKGLVHLTVFAFLVVLSHTSLIFLMFVFGWVFYMAIEAHHTAQAKRDGTPLPNPFGLNDIGERMGFGTDGNGFRPSAQSVANAARDAAQAAGFRPHPATAAPGQPEPPPQPGAATAGWGAPVDSYPGSYPGTYPGAYSGTYPGAYAGAVPPYPPAYTPPFTAQEWQDHGGGYAPAYGRNYPAYGGPIAPPFTPGAAPAMGPIAPRSRFPVGAVWLIALGAVFLLGTEGIFRGLRGETLVGILFLGFAVTLFARRMTALGHRIENDGSPDYQFRLLYALKPTVWLLLLGVLFLLDSFDLLRWSRSWPLFLIVGGVMMLLRRAPITPAYAYPPVPPAAPVAATPEPGSEMVRLNLRTDDVARTESSEDSHTGGY